MTEVMASQPGLGLTAPSSRQDIVSALLNDYGNSFGRGDESPYAYSPVPAVKELPPPPPGNHEKPLPSVMMRFQLRVDEANLQDGQRRDSIESPTKIVSRSMSRSSKPPSLRLLASNGATAIVPPMPMAPPAPPKDVPSSIPSDPFEDRPLPPPPPEKSERRMSQRRAQMAMENVKSKVDRRDSKEPQDSESMANKPQQEQPQPAPVMKRKPVPVPSVKKKFPSLADLQKGPRGRSVAPKPTTASADPASEAESVAAPRGSSQESSRRPSIPSIREQSRGPTSTRASQDSSRRPSLPGSQERNDKPATLLSVDEAPTRNALSGHRPTFSKSSLSSQLPPTPDEQQYSEPKVEAPLPPPPRKVFAGLPSNPRSKAPEPTKHTRGKSSTGFDIMKSTNKPAPVQTMNLNTITPGPTPSPRKTEEAQKSQGQSMASSVQAALRRPQSPISPVSDYDGSRRPFSFEGAQAPKQPRQQQSQGPQRPMSPVSPQEVASQFPPRTTSRPDAQPVAQQNPFLDPAQPPPQARSETPTDEPPFIPLTVSPIPAATPKITGKELNCYTNHATFARFYAKHQPMGCMVCRQDTDPRKVSCHWCYLRICFGCQDELSRIPGRDLSVLMEQKGMKANGRQEEGMPSVVVWEAEGEGDDFS